MNMNTVSVGGKAMGTGDVKFFTKMLVAHSDTLWTKGKKCLVPFIVCSL